MKMEPMINQLLRVLEWESELYQSMLTVIDQESKGAIRSDLNALTKAGEEKENILVKLRSIEEQRIRLVRETADALGYPPREFTLTMMSQLVGEPLAGRLSQAGTDLSTVLNAVKDANHRNKQLFEHFKIKTREESPVFESGVTHKSMPNIGQKSWNFKNVENNKSISGKNISKQREAISLWN